MKNWLDKYDDGGPVQENYNDYSVSAPEGFQGDGYSDVGRDYSPAWGGQFADGGELPNVTVKGKRQPIIVTDPNDPRLKAYQDSLGLYNQSKNTESKISKIFANGYKRGGFDQESINRELFEGKDIVLHPEKYTKKQKHYVDSKVKKYNKKGLYYESFPGEEYLGTLQYPATIKNLIKYNKEDIANRNPNLLDTDINGLTEKERIEIAKIANAGLQKQYDIIKRTGYDPTYFIPNGERPPTFIFKKPTQPVIYQSEPERVNQKETPELQDLQAGLPVNISLPELQRPKRPIRYTMGKPLFPGGPQTDYYTPIDEAGNVVPTSNWNQKFAMGGSMPGAVGFMYARTNDPAPSNGPYAKKTKASAENGAEMRFYQEGLDFKPKTISKDGKVVKWANERAKNLHATSEELKASTYFPNSATKFFDNYLNPLPLITETAAGLAEIPQNIQKGNYGSAALNFLNPVAQGFGARVIERVTPLVTKTLKQAIPQILEDNPITNRFVYGKNTPEVQIPKQLGRTAKSYKDVKVVNEFPLDNQLQLSSNASLFNKLNPGELLINNVSQPAKLKQQATPFLSKIASGADKFDEVIQSRINDLTSAEGNRRLVNQEAQYLRAIGFPKSEIAQQAEKNAVARIKELERSKSGMIPGTDIGYKPTLNKQAKVLLEKEGPEFVKGLERLANEELLSNNAFYRQPHRLIDQDLWDNPLASEIFKSDASINLAKKTQLGGSAFAGDLAVGAPYVNNAPTMTHELAHALQRGRRLPIDNELRQIQPIDAIDSPSASRYYNYFNSGSGGKEPTAFANELREAMLERGFIKNRYDEITPDLLQKAHKSFLDQPSGLFIKGNEPVGSYLSDTRIFDFMKPSPENYQILSGALNKLPVAAPAVIGAGAIAAGSMNDQYKQGGQLTKLDQLTNFTNYNTKQPGGWLDKYEG